MEYLALAVILYFILRTAGNLVRLLGGEENPSQRAERQSSSSRRNGWEGPSPRERTGTAQDEPTYWGKDVEDATWRDIEGESQGRSGAAR